jgi:hypothetical protein
MPLALRVRGCDLWVMSGSEGVNWGRLVATTGCFIGVCDGLSPPLSTPVYYRRSPKTVSQVPHGRPLAGSPPLLSVPPNRQAARPTGAVRRCLIFLSPRAMGSAVRCRWPIYFLRYSSTRSNTPDEAGASSRNNFQCANASPGARALRSFAASVHMPSPIDTRRSGKTR